MKTFHGHGIQFQYLPNWELTADIGSDRIDISILGPGTAMWMLSIFRNRDDPEQLVNEVIGSFKDEYPSCDVYDSNEAICLLPTSGKDLDFFHHDLINHVFIRACEGDTESYLLVYQVAEIEKEEILPALIHMTDSLMTEDPSLDDDDELNDLAPFRFHNLFAEPEDLK